jgi:hypothetical protein
MATVTASKTWVSGETVTPAGLNLTAAPTVVVADGEVTTAKLADGISPTKLAGQGYVYVSTIYYTAAGTSTFSKATYSWLRAIRVKCQAGGGGGGGCATTGASQNALGSAGGGGAYAEKFITDIAGLGASVTVTVGAGGAGGSAGNNAGATGESSSFGVLCSANGGVGGNGGPAGTLSANFHYVSNPAVGATVGTGDLVVPGRSGQVGYGVHETVVNNGAGGDSFLGAGGANSAVSTGTNGAAGSQGGGGSGGVNIESRSVARTGGAGGAGVVILELYA